VQFHPLSLEADGDWKQMVIFGVEKYYFDGGQLIIKPSFTGTINNGNDGNDGTT